MRIFFKLCILDCGIFLRSDSCSVDRDKFDYARILIATPSLEVINCVEKLVVDGEVVEIKILEEWGFNMGEDVCLYDSDDGTRSSNVDPADIGGDNVHDCDTVNILVDKIVKDLSKVSKDESVMPEISVKAPSINMEGEAEQFLDDIDELPDSRAVHVEPCVKQHVGSNDGCGSGNDKGMGMTSEVKGQHPIDVTQEVVPLDFVHPNSKLKGRRGRASSCPPRAARSVESGPWSIEWLSDQNHGDVAVISSSKKKVKKVVRSKVSISHAWNVVKKRKKVNRTLKHSVNSLKKVACSPYHNRSAVLHILKNKSRKLHGSKRLQKAVKEVSKNVSEGSSSSGSVNNDWVN